MSGATLKVIEESELEPEIGRLLDRLYAVISFEEDSDPDWRGLSEVFSKHARITRITPDGIDYLDARSFLEMTKNLLEIGAYTAFHEVEVARRVERFGKVAQVWSLYQTRRSRSALAPLGSGINSIQLLREASEWRVVGLLWDETHAATDLEVSAAFDRGSV